MSKIRTTLNISPAVFQAAEYEVEVEIEYSATAGCQATYTQPGEDDSAEITGVTIIMDGKRATALWLVDLLGDDDDLLAECLADWREDQIAQAEYAAEARAEDAMMRRAGE